MQLTREECNIYELAMVRAKKYLSAEAALLDSVMEIDRTKLYKKCDEEFLTPFCVKHFRISEEIAATFVRVARKSLVVPQLKAAVDDGRLNITKAKTIAAVVTPDNVQEWTEKAAKLSKAKFEYEVVKENPKAAKPEKAKPVGEDRFRLECELTEAIYEQFQRAKELASQSRGATASIAETVETMIKTYLQYRDPVEKAKRAHAKKSMPSTRKDVERSRERREHPSASEIHTVNLRDQRKCQQKKADGTLCLRSKWVQIHHKVEVSEGGSNKAENLITLCSHHHRKLHRPFRRSDLTPHPP